MTDASQDQATRARLERANVVTPHRGGMTHGGDILIPHGLDMHPGPLSKPVVINLTVVSEWVYSHVSDVWPASTAEARKRTKYTRMYDTIGYDFQGFAAEIEGRLGPEAEKLIENLQKIWWAKMGKKAIPDDANWTCPLFSSYWRQRLVGAVQGWTGAMLVGRVRQVADLRGSR